MFSNRIARSSCVLAPRKVLCSLLRSSSTQTITSESTWQPLGGGNQPYSSPRQDARCMNMDKVRTPGDAHASKRRKLDRPVPFLPEGTNEEIISLEVADLLSKVSLNNSNGHAEESGPSVEAGKSQSKDAKQAKSPFEDKEEIELEIVSLSSTGDGLAYNSTKDHVVVVPFAVPGDRVLAREYRWAGSHSLADFIKIVTPSPQREGTTPKCQYFSKCSGCQFQMLSYETQLEHKRTILENAFKNFSGMKPEQIPDVEPTMGSPFQYGYRTKLTPHFTRPFSRKVRAWDHIPNIGYNIKGRRDVMDIESCPIGTDIVQEGLKVERERVKETLQNFKNGATILIRETTDRTYTSESPNTKPKQISSPTEFKPLVSTNLEPPEFSLYSIPSDPRDLNLQSTILSPSTKSGHSKIINKYPTHIDTKGYTSNEKAEATEYVTVTTDTSTTPPKTRTYKFTNTAGSFFQNNNSILGPFTSYIYSQCLPNPSSSSSSPPAPTQKPIKYLLDAYSGSGLFTLTLSPLFASSLGIDIDARSIEAARNNATTNNLTNTGFIDADAAALFLDVPYPPDQTLVVIDPPRKGCDRAFLQQLRRFGPKRVVYVSCNVHTQARDVGVLVNGFVRGGMSKDGRGFVGDGIDEEWEAEEGLSRYRIEKLRGFDFFPQTGHVEGVCILDRIG